MKKEKKLVFLLLIGILILGIVLFIILNRKESNITVNLNSFTYTNKEENRLRVYTQDEFDTFYKDYQNNNLDEVYATEFLFDGVGMYKTYDLDDFIDDGNDTEVKALKITVININTSGNVTLMGDLTGMIALDTNKITDDVNIILNGVRIDTDSKKVPAVYVYNKDITYTGSKVTIKTIKDTTNYIEGGKLKKVSLLESDNLDNYASKYSGDNLTNYNNYTNYYGVYSSSQLDNILFAKVQADNEDLMDGDPYYYYKASGAISSDIDLYFDGDGYLEVISKNKEGIETKGNLEFIGGSGDYKVVAMDDCLNTTTDNSENSNARNTMTIDVNSLTAIVSLEADEGDAIDSNGTLTINNGRIIAISKPGQDAGLDSSKGTYINGGTVIATGDMLDEIYSDSKQNYIVLSFQEKPTDNMLITLLDESDNVIFAYKTDRTYSNLVYSSSSLDEGTYYLYKDGDITGDNTNGFYYNVTNYVKGTELGYSSNTVMNGFGNMNGNPPQKPDGEDTNMGNNPPQKPDGNMQGPNNMNMGNPTNNEFSVTEDQNIFSGIGTLVKSEE